MPLEFDKSHLLIITMMATVLQKILSVPIFSIGVKETD